MTKELAVPHTPAERTARLRALRDEKMGENTHAFVRARIDLFCQVMAHEAKGLPIGPGIWISGDAHVENFGAVPDVAGNVELLLNDFDESVIGDPSFDLARLALSLATAARGSGRSGHDVHGAVAAITDGYEAAMDRVIHPEAPKRENKSARLSELVRQAAEQTRGDLLIKLTGEDHPRALPLGDRFWPLSSATRDALGALAAETSIGELAATSNAGEPPRLKLIDATFRVAGTASLGGFRAAMLISVDDAPKGERLRIFDVKKATPSAVPALAATPKDDADRSLEGSRVLAPPFGARKRASIVQGIRVVVRELMAQERKVDCEGLSDDELPSIGFTLGKVLGKAHGRQLSVKDAKSWRAEVSAKRADGRPPEWLARTLAALVGAHESAYLAHCREHAR